MSQVSSFPSCHFTANIFLGVGKRNSRASYPGEVKRWDARLRDRCGGAVGFDVYMNRMKSNH